MVGSFGPRGYECVYPQHNLTWSSLVQSYLAIQCFQCFPILLGHPSDNCVNLGLGSVHLPVATDKEPPRLMMEIICENAFLATLVALHFTPVSKSVSESVSRSFGLA